MNKLLQHIMAAGDVSDKYLPHLEKYQTKGKVVDINSQQLPKAQLGSHMLPIDPAKAAENFFEILSAPQKYITSLFSGKYQRPSEAMNIKNPVKAFATDVVLDPFNLFTGAGLASKAVKAGVKPVTKAASSAVKKVIGKQLNEKLPATTAPSTRALASDMTISEEGNRILKRLASPEGKQRLRQQFKQADPSLNDEQIEYLVHSRINEVNTAVNYNKARYYLDFGKGKQGTPTENVPFNHFLPLGNAHFSDTNLYPGIRYLDAPADLFPKKVTTQSVPGGSSGRFNLAKPTVEERLKSFADPRYRPGSIALGTGLELNKNVAAHEIMHAIQNSGMTPVDVDLLNLLQPKNAADQLFRAGVRFSPKIFSRDLGGKRLSQLGEDLKYFTTSGGRGAKTEPYPFLEELRNRMLNRGIIQDDYEKITPWKLAKARLDAVRQVDRNFQEGTRLIKFTPPWKYGKLAEIMNYAPAGLPAIGAATYLGAQEPEMKNEGGEPTEYKGSSIVDYLATKGYSGKKSFRKGLAEQYGVQDYDFSAQKNLELLAKLRENDDILEAVEQDFKPVPVERLEKLLQQKTQPSVEAITAATQQEIETEKRKNFNKIRRRMTLDLGYDPYLDQPRPMKLNTPNLSLSSISVGSSAGRAAAPAPAPQKKQQTAPVQQAPAPVQQSSVSVTGTGPLPNPNAFLFNPSSLYSFDNRIAPVPQKQPAAIKNVGKRIAEGMGSADPDNRAWYEKAWDAFSEAVNDSEGLDWRASNLGGAGFSPEGAQPMVRDIAINAAGLFSENTKRKAENYFKRKDLKDNENLQETRTKLKLPVGPIKPDIITGDTIPINKDGVAGRYIIPGVINLNNTNWGYRNRDQFTDITTEGGDITLFNNLVPATQYFKDNPNSKDTDSFIGITPDGKPVAGTKKDFVNSNALISKTFSNKIVDFPRDEKGELVLKSSSTRASSKHLTPVVNVIDDNNRVVQGSLNFLIPKRNKDRSSFGDITGGRVIFKAPDGQMRLAMGSAEDIARSFEQFKKEGNYPYLTAFTNDNGTYGPGIRTKSGKITAKDLENYQGANTSGSVFMYLKPGSYNRGAAAPKSKFRDVQMTTPNIRTEKDDSFKKGHSLTNAQQAVVLHHTGYTDTAGVSKGMSKAMKGVAEQFSKPGESSHVVIDFDGTRYNYARPDQVTFHAGKSMLRGKDNVNDFGIGIEFQGDTDQRPLTDAQIESFVEYIAPLIRDKKIPLENIVTHKQIRDEYIKTNKGDKDVKTKPDVADRDYKRIVAALKKKGIYEHGGAVIDPRGQWAYPGQETIVPTPDGKITMQGVPYPVYGQDETGYGQMMYPGGEYTFPGQMVYETPMMQRGGSLPTYQIQGQVRRAPLDNTRQVIPLNIMGMMKDYEYAADQFNKGKIFHEQWMQSPMYKKMIQASDPQNAKEITELRKKNLKNVRFQFLPEQPLDMPNTGGYSSSFDGKITFLPHGVGVRGMGTHELSHSADRPSKADIIKSGLKRLFTDYEGEPTRIIPSKDIDRIHNISIDNYRRNKDMSEEASEWFDYVTNPTETRARLNDIRQQAAEYGLYDPFTQRVTPEIYKNKLKKFKFERGKNRGFDALKQLRGVYTDEQIINLLNSVSQNNSEIGLDQAKNGGQHGGLDRWFAEKWVDIKTGKTCGRQEGENRSYPACRPSKRVSSKTPKTSSEMSPAEKAKFKRSKTSSERINYNHKRN